MLMYIYKLAKWYKLLAINNAITLDSSVNIIYFLLQSQMNSELIVKQYTLLTQVNSIMT